MGNFQRPTGQQFAWGVAERVLAGLIVAGVIGILTYVFGIWSFPEWLSSLELRALR